VVGKGKLNPASYKARPARLAGMAGARVTIAKIVSGGQTGVDRAALDFARERGIAHGGWCPRGRWAEDGAIHEDYDLDETPDRSCAQRTAWNVRDSDGTVIFTVAAQLSGGSALTRRLALSHGKPCLHLASQAAGDAAPARLREFILSHGIKVLNVAGPRLSTEAGARAFAMQVLEAAVTARDR
jgi:hypothetical protein